MGLCSWSLCQIIYNMDGEKHRHKQIPKSLQDEKNMGGNQSPSWKQHGMQGMMDSKYHDGLKYLQSPLACTEYVFFLSSICILLWTSLVNQIWHFSYQIKNVKKY
jgi:hypothetical protein